MRAIQNQTREELKLFEIALRQTHLQNRNFTSLGDLRYPIKPATLLRLLTRVTKTILLCFEVINQKTIKIMEIYVGNLPWSVGDQDLADTFKQYGTVDRASVIVERPSGRSKGFGFVTMNDNSEASAAIEALNGSDMGGRPLKVNEARPKD